MIVLIRGGGDLASGVALRLHRLGLQVVITELPQPLAVRRLVSFSEAIYAGQWTVEGVIARRVEDPTDTLRILQVYTRGQVPVLVDHEAVAIQNLHPTVVIDARMLKRPAELIRSPVKLIIGLGPGFTVGENCHTVIETKRGHMLGRVIWQGSSEPDTGVPDSVGDYRSERVLRSPAEGVLNPAVVIGDHLEGGQLICDVAGVPVIAPFRGVLRGLIHNSVRLTPGMKIGDVDPRDDPRHCALVSDKSLAIAGGVIEAMLSRPELRKSLWV